MLLKTFGTKVRRKVRSGSDSSDGVGDGDGDGKLKKKKKLKCFLFGVTQISILIKYY